MRLLKKINTSQIKAIVFDLDDTLYPQIDYKRSGFKVVSDWAGREFKIEQRSVAANLEDILGRYGPSYPYMFDRLAERINLDKSAVPSMVAVFIQHNPKLKCYPGVMEMLIRLRKHYRLGILTDGRHTVQMKKIQALGLEPMVDEILCSNAMGLEKPAAELFEWFEEKFSLSGINLMYVGDNPQKDFCGANLRQWSTVRVLDMDRCCGDLPAMFREQFSISSVVGLEKFLATNSRQPLNQ